MSNAPKLVESTTFNQSPEAISAIWHRLDTLARSIRDDETRVQYLARWRARFALPFPAADGDDPILPNGVIIGEVTPKERRLLAFVAGRWWRREVARLTLPDVNIKAVALSLGRRIAAGLLERAACEAEVPPEILTMPAWSDGLKKGLGWAFTGQAQVLHMRLSRKPMTGFGMAERWFARSGHDFAYTTAKGWMAWDKRRWRVLDQEQNVLPAEVKASIFEAIRAVQDEAQVMRFTGVPPQSLGVKALERYQAEGKALNDEGLNWGGVSAHTLAEWGRACETGGMTAAVASVAMQWLTRAINDFDKEAMAVNCLNGTLRFERTEDGRFVSRLDAHERTDFLTRIAAVDYDADAPAPLFDELIKWAQPPRDRRRYVRQWLGYNLTGHTGAQILHFWYGKGANGKGTVIEACSAAMGDYSDTIGVESLLDQSVKKRGDSASPDLAKLTGVRLLRASEPEENARLNEALIKLVTGQDTFPVRMLHKGFFNLTPDFKLTIAGNHPIVIKGTDEGIWRRLKQIPWEAFMPPEGRDMDLPDKLRGELPGIFAWMVRGLVDWLQHGFVEPGSVTEATAAWRDDSDPVGKFLTACTVADPASRVQSSVLHAVYIAWATVADEYAIKNKSFSQTLKKKGYAIKTSNGNHVMGIKLIKSVHDFVDNEGKPLRLSDEGEAVAPVAGSGGDGRGVAGDDAGAADWGDDDGPL